MAIKTRSKPTSKNSDLATDSEPTNKLAASDPNPPKLCVLPKDTSPEARILTLPNPATSNPSRYFFCPEKGIYEFTKLAAPRSTPRSWFIAPRRKSIVATVSEKVVVDEEIAELDGRASEEIGSQEVNDSEKQTEATGYVNSHADLFVATPLDPLFMVMPALAPSSSKEKQMFLSVDDHLDNVASKPYHLRHLLQSPRFRSILEGRMAAVCDTVDAGDEKMYRLSLSKLADELLSKAERMTQNGLPASLEDRFVQRALEAPLTSIKREISTISQAETQNIAPATEDSQAQKQQQNRRARQSHKIALLLLQHRSLTALKTTQTLCHNQQKPHLRVCHNFFGFAQL
jgi:hypothetical protein